MRLTMLSTVAALSIVAAAPAMAATVIDFDTLPGGAAVPDETPIGTQYASLGVTFSASYQNAAVLPVATNYAGGPSGPLYSGNYLGNAPSGSPFIFNPDFQLTPRYDVVSIAFDGTASNLSMSFNNFSRVGQTTFNAYGTDGSLLQSYTTNAGDGWAIRSIAVNGVARLDLVNVNGNFFGVDQLTYDLVPNAAVPEPAAWALMIGGFGLVGGTMRRSRHAGLRLA